MWNGRCGDDDVVVVLWCSCWCCRCCVVFDCGRTENNRWAQRSRSHYHLNHHCHYHYARTIYDNNRPSYAVGQEQSSMGLKSPVWYCMVLLLYGKSDLCLHTVWTTANPLYSWNHLQHNSLSLGIVILQYYMLIDCPHRPLLPVPRILCSASHSDPAQPPQPSPR